MAGLDDEPNLCRAAFILLIFGISDLVGGSAYSLSATFSGRVVDERIFVCAAFSILLVERADGISQMSFGATSFILSLLKHFAVMTSSRFVQVVIRFRSHLKKTFEKAI